MIPGRSATLDEMAGALEGVIPATICTVSADGVPNITYISVVHRAGPEHVALSRQFFRKTEENTIENPLAQVALVDPTTGRQYRLDLEYERTEVEGALFEKMRSRLDAVSAHEGMTNVFKLKGTDVCRVLGVEHIASQAELGAVRREVRIEAVEEFSSRMADAEDMDELLGTAFEAANQLLGAHHAFVMLLDEAGEKLYTVASGGYPASGIGSEVRLGEGMIGYAAAQRQSIRVMNMAREIGYLQAAHESVLPVSRVPIEQVIPLPSLEVVQSQLVTPMLAHRRLVGVLCLQSERVGAFHSADECIVAILGNQLAMAMSQMRAAPPPVREDQPVAPGGIAGLATYQVKHYREDDSVFIDNEYLIKGVAGGILWRLLRYHQDEGRSEFSNKEIRLDQTLDLPEIKDNLEARLILLRKRLEERCEYIRLEKTARGRFRIAVSRPIVLVEAEGGGPL